MFELVVEGPPVPELRARKGKHGWYTPSVVTEYRERVVRAWELAGSPSVEGPCVLSASFHMPRPKAHYRTGRNSHLLKDSAPRSHTSKPDLSNLVKNLEDALNGYAIKDDSAIVCLAGLHKLWHEGEGKTVLRLWASRSLAGS